MDEKTDKIYVKMSRKSLHSAKKNIFVTKANLLIVGQNISSDYPPFGRVIESNI